VNRKKERGRGGRKDPPPSPSHKERGVDCIETSYLRIINY
jgi:hypothetical protein